MGMKNILVIKTRRTIATVRSRRRPTTKTEGRKRRRQEKNNGGVASGYPASQPRTANSASPGSTCPPHLFILQLCRRHAETWTRVTLSPADAIECGIVKLPRVPVAEKYPRQ
jgi:hypothetical protein